MKLYLASLFGEREQRAHDGNYLKQFGFDICSTWVYGSEEGLSNAEIAELDLKDVRECDAILNFTHPHGTRTPGGGRHVEFGYALALGKRCVVVGPLENVFHWTPGVEQYDSLEEFIHEELRDERLVADRFAMSVR